MGFGFGLIANPLGPIQFLLEENFTRKTDTPYSPGRGRSFDRDVNRAMLGIRIRPGGGAFNWDLGVRNTIDLWENNQLSIGRNIYTEVVSAAKWKFFPKTAIVWDVSVGYRDYFVGNAATFGYYNVDSFPLRTYLGVIGLITPKIQFLVKGGYGNSFHRTGDPINTGTSYEGPLAKVNLTFRLSYRSKLSFTYTHDFADAIFANYYIKDEGKISYDQAIGNRVVIGVGARVAYLNYDAAPPAPPGVVLPMADRREIRYGGSVKIDVYFTDWLFARASYELVGNFSNYIVTETGVGPDNPSFIKHIIRGGIAARY